MRAEMAGRDLTEHMKKVVMESGVVWPRDQQTIACDMEEQQCYVALDYDEEVTKDATTVSAEPFELPDGSTINVGTMCFRCPEALFKPHHIGLEGPGLHEMTYQSINRCAIDVRRDLYSNIVLTGGTTMFKGLPERLSMEVSNLGSSSSVKPKVVAPPERKYAAWIGGSILSSLTTFQTMWITKREYEESGEAIVHDKCHFAWLRLSCDLD